MGTVIRETRSVCPVCLQNLPAKLTRETDGRILLEKRCPEHGAFRVPVWRGRVDWDTWLLGTPPLEADKGLEGGMLDIMELWARDLMAVQNGAAPYQLGDADRLRRSRIDGEALLKGVQRVRMQLESNVAWPCALENMYFNLLKG